MTLRQECLSDVACAMARSVFAETMLLTVSKRLEFSASRRLRVPKWGDNENLAVLVPKQKRVTEAVEITPPILFSPVPSIQLPEC